jgi:hypothetical protein
MAELSNLSDRQLKKEIGAQEELGAKLMALDSHEVVRSGRADEVIAQLKAAGERADAVRTELQRRERQASTRRSNGLCH